MSAPLIPDYKKLGNLFGHDGVAEKRLMTTKEKFHPTASNDEIDGGTIQLIGNMSSQSAGQPNAFCIEKLDNLFGRDGATEKRSMTTKEKLFQLASVNEIDGGIIQLIDNVFPLQPNASSSSERKKRNGEKKELKQPNASSSSMRKRKRDGETKGLKDVEIIKEAIEKVAKAIREGNNIHRRLQSRIYSKKKLFPEFETIGLEKELHIKAYLYLTKDEKRIETFFDCPSSVRKEILLGMLCEARVV